MDMQSRPTSELLIAIVLGTLLAGCGGEPKRLPAAGVVTLDGQPVADAGVLFIPTDPGPAATGTTDASGRFRLTCAGKAGAIAGHYRVAISKQASAGNGDTGPMPAMPAKNLVAKWIVPQKYGTPDTSGLEATVSSEQYEFTFALMSR